MAAARARLSLVQDSGQYASSCGYCGTRATHEDSSWSHGMMAEVLTAEAYQALIDRCPPRTGAAGLPAAASGALASAWLAAQGL